MKSENTKDELNFDRIFPKKANNSSKNIKKEYYNEKDESDEKVLKNPKRKNMSYTNQDYNCDNNDFNSSTVKTSKC